MRGNYRDSIGLGIKHRKSTRVDYKDGGLILTGKLGDVIYIWNKKTGEVVQFSFIGIKGNQIRYALAGPDDYEFLRGEAATPEEIEKIRAIMLKQSKTLEGRTKDGN